MNNPIKIGIGSYTYTWAIGVPGYGTSNPLSAFDLIEKAAELNAEVVQFADNLPLHRYNANEQLKLLSFAQEKSINIEVGAKGLTSSSLEQYIEIAGNVHSDILRFIIDKNDYEPTLDEIVATISPFISNLEKANIKLVLENHDRLKCEEFAYIIKACDSPYVGICLDTVNSIGVPEGTEEVVNILSPFTLNLHVKDFNISRLQHRMGFKVEGAPAGKGKLNIAALFAQLHKIGKCNTAILELWTPFGATLEETIARESQWAKESMKYLHQLSY